jgi:hypothetical protein
MFEGEQHPRAGALVTFVNQHRAALEEVAIPLEGEVERGVEQGVARDR